MKGIRFLGIILLLGLVLFTGCKKDSPEEVLQQFFQLVREGRGSEAFEKYVDLDDFMLILGFEKVVETPELSENHSSTLPNKKTPFQKVWEKNAKKIDQAFLKQLKEIKEYNLDSKKPEGEDYIMLVTTIYTDGTRKQEEIYLRRVKISYKIVLSKLREVDYVD